MHHIFIAFLLLWLVFLPSPASHPQKDQKIDYLKTYARLYGYIRYFHPSDEASAVDWDQLAIYGAQKVEGAHDRTGLIQVLNDIFLPVAPTVLIYPSSQKEAFDMASVTPPEQARFKTIAWQHQGVKLNGPKNVYQSLRTNRPVKEKRHAGFGTIISGLNAENYQGQEIKLTASVKVDTTSSGSGHLWLRVERPNKQMGFFDNMDNRPIKTARWQEYEITGKVAADADNIVFGCFLQGEGKLWVDNFQLYTKAAGAWKPVAIQENSFETSSLNGKPKNWYAQSDGYQFMVTDATAADGQQSVVIASNTGTMNISLFGQYPHIGEYIQKDIGSGVSCMVPLALYGTESHTYPQTDEAVFHQYLQKVASIRIDQLTGDDLSLRLGATIIAWNVFQHFYPYFDQVQADWEAALDEALASCYQDQSETDFLKTLRKLTAKLQDGHVRVSLEGNDKENYFPPLAWQWIEDQLLIMQVEDAEADIEKGDIVKAIDGKKPKAYFDEVYTQISAATDGWRRYRGQTASLVGGYHTALHLQVQKPDGTTKKVTLSRVVPQQAYAQDYVESPIKDKFAEIEEGIYYLNLDKISMPEINEHLDELVQAKSIICDLRGYPNNNHAFIQHLLTVPDTSSAWMQIPQIIYPDHENLVGYEKMGWELQPLAPHLDAKIIFITDGRAISYAESFLGFIEAYDLATIIGQPTAGTNGNVNSFTLPGGYRISWTGMRVVKPDGSRHHGVGIQPDIYVQQTIEGVRAGRDEFLEKAIEIAKHG